MNNDVDEQMFEEQRTNRHSALQESNKATQDSQKETQDFEGTEKTRKDTPDYPTHPHHDSLKDDILQEITKGQPVLQETPGKTQISHKENQDMEKIQKETQKFQKDTQDTRKDTQDYAIHPHHDILKQTIIQMMTEGQTVPQKNQKKTQEYPENGDIHSEIQETLKEPKTNNAESQKETQKYQNKSEDDIENDDGQELPNEHPANQKTQKDTLRTQSHAAEIQETPIQDPVNSGNDKKYSPAILEEEAEEVGQDLEVTAPMPIRKGEVEKAIEIEKEPKELNGDLKIAAIKDDSIKKLTQLQQEIVARWTRQEGDEDEDADNNIISIL